MSEDKEIYTYLDVLEKLQNYCAYRDRCHSEVKDKLFQYHLEEDQELYIFQRLIEDNYLNEERYVNSFVSGKFNIKRWGKQKIRQALKQKKISAKLIEKVLSQIDQQEYLSVLKELYLKKINSYKEGGYIGKQKTIKYLLQKGYEYSEIKIVIEEVEK